MSHVELRRLFERVNADCERAGEMVVPFSDHEFYAEQIVNVLDEQVTYTEAFEIAELL